MKKKTTKSKPKKDVCKTNFKCDSGCGGVTYILGFIGAAIYYISTATCFWCGVLGVLKAIIWPVFLVYGLLKQIGM
jgi:hypothetical protein